MREVLFVLTYLAILYVVILEFLDKCDHALMQASRGIHLGSLGTLRQ